MSASKTNWHCRISIASALQLNLPEIKTESRHHLPIRQSNHASWIEFNEVLNQDARSLVNEKSIAQRIDESLHLETGDQRLFWLTLARIAELALIQAGAYADACEFQAAGDLLVNPRRFEVHLNGEWDPVVKQRHSRLSTQFKTDIGSESAVCWLSRRATPCIAMDAILPWLTNTLASSGAMASDYLEALHRRMCRVADTLSFLISWRVEDGSQFQQKIQTTDPHGDAFVEANLCRFDTNRFVYMHDDIQSIILSGRCSTRFLSCRNPE